MQLRAIDLFSGAGGLSAGLSKAGFTISAALESVPRFAETHAVNFPDANVIVADASMLSPKLFSQRTGINPGELDLIAGGPPCQTFSPIGGAKIRHVSQADVAADPRNYLFKDFLQYVAFFQPRAFLMENVPQLKTKYKGRLFERLLDLVCDLNYQVHIAVLNAADFGVPQIRKRLFVFGIKSGSEFKFPTPTFGASAPPNEPDLFDAAANEMTSNYRTVMDALGDLPEIYDGCRLGDLPYRTDAQNAYQLGLRSRRGVVGNNVCRVSNERAKAVFKYMRPGQKYMDLAPDVRKILPFREDIFHDRLKRLDPEAPSWTVLAHIGMDGYMYIHPTEDRTLSVREAARIQSFDDDFVFTGNMREQYVQVGNAVPPALSQALGQQIRNALL